MADPITTATGIIGIAQTLGNLLGRVKDRVIRNELQDSIFRIREEAIRLQGENATLRDEIRKLRETASERANPADFEREGNAFRRDGTAYCIRCMEEDHKGRTLIQQNEYNTEGFCPTCKGQFDGVFPAKPMTMTMPMVLKKETAIDWENWP